MSEITKTWLIVGASRGIGLEFVRQLLSRGHRVLATVRNANSNLEKLAEETPDQLQIFKCDVSSEESINDFVSQIAQSGVGIIDYAVINAGILKYPNRALSMTFDQFATHLHTNTIGPIIVAQKLLALNLKIGTIAFMSSDSGSTARFLAFEDGFAAYGASKAALNQAMRHMTEELKRQQSKTVLIALHPGEVATDMSNIDIPWEIDGGMITAEESVVPMISVIESKKSEHTGTFWTWENEEYPW